jgi:hypothetical protein
VFYFERMAGEMFWARFGCMQCCDVGLVFRSFSLAEMGAGQRIWYLLMCRLGLQTELSVDDPEAKVPAPEDLQLVCCRRFGRNRPYVDPPLFFVAFWSVVETCTAGAGLTDSTDLREKSELD